MKTELQKAEELKDYFYYGWEYESYNPPTKKEHEDNVKNIVKERLEKLGCGKKIKNKRNNFNFCGYDNEMGYGKSLCPDCIAKGHDKAKEIYEGILK